MQLEIDAVGGQEIEKLVARTSPEALAARRAIR